MSLTEEQRKIIQAKGNLKINAVAGSGKTTTIIEYAKS
ncbi:UvrD-helicase domain-containing protein [Candidatus Nitrosacidococcus tergens]|nr:UvrD-helicase domain-containing protein [Candidatus Nitrosacidococcus tergens]